MAVARKQTLVQLTDELVYALDREAVRTGKSRSALIREAVEAHLYDEVEAEISRQIVDGYTRMPQSEEEVRFGDWAARESNRMLSEQEEEGW